MKKIFFILLIVFFSSSLFAGVNEPGSGYVNSYTQILKEYEHELEIGAKKKKHTLIYVSTGGENSWAWDGSHFKEINTKAHEKSYKRCMKWAKKYTGEDCFLFAIDDEILWKNYYDKASAKVAVVEEEPLFLLTEDKKTGRFFEDQIDVNDDYQIHFIYFLAKNTKDKERDLNGWIEKQAKKMDDLFFQLTGNKQRFKFDYRKDGKLDITFARMDRKAKKGGWNTNYPDYYLTKHGFNNPKKIYFSFTDGASGDGGQCSPHHCYLFIGKASGYIDTIGVHELLHGLAFAMPCTRGVTRGAHLNSGILGPDLQKSLGKAIYNHGDPTCPDLKDSVYLTPTSEDPFDPLQIACALGQKKRGNPPGDFKIPSRYTHKKLLKGRKDEWCTYNLHTYAQPNWFGKWKK